MATGRCYLCVFFMWGCWTILPPPSVSGLYYGAHLAIGIPGRPVKLKCVGFLMNEQNGMRWQVSLNSYMPAKGYLSMDEVASNPFYSVRLVDGQVELSSNGSLTIHSYEAGHNGLYICVNSRYQQLSQTRLQPFRPKIRGLSHRWRGREQPDIKCEAAYYNERSVNFTWELVRPNGDAITLPGSSVEPVHQYSVVFYKSSLDYSLSTDDIQSTLRCIARLDDETYGSYQAKTEQRIHSYGSVLGLPGRPVRMECGDANLNALEELEWCKKSWSIVNYCEPLAEGVYMNGIMNNVSYHNRLVDRQAELTQDASLTIHNYTPADNGYYCCHSKYRKAITRLTVFGTLPDPHIRGLENGLFIPEGENITCQVHYHWSGNVTFAWELDRNGGPKLHLPGHMESVFQHRNNTATFVWALNFTLDHSHRGNKLRCVARVNNMIHRNYIATDERRILVYDAPPAPEIRGLENGLSNTEPQNIACHVRCILAVNMSFSWMLDGKLGLQIFPPGYLEVLNLHRNDTVSYIWVLNFTLEQEHSGYKLRCILHVDNEIHRDYTTKAEVVIQFCGYPQRIQMFGSEMPLIVDQPHNVTCLVTVEACCKWDITLSWTLQGKQLPEIVLVEESDVSSTTFESKLNYDIMAGDEGSRVSCVVDAVCIDQHRRYSNSVSTLLDVYYTYGSMVIPWLNKDPSTGEDYALRCITLTEGRPNKIIRYTWFKDGKNLKESDKFVAKGESLIIKVYEEDVDSGVYSCHIKNFAGITKIGEAKPYVVTNSDNSSVYVSLIALAVTIPTIPAILICAIVLHRFLLRRLLTTRRPIPMATTLQTIPLTLSPASTSTTVVNGCNPGRNDLPGPASGKSFSDHHSESVEKCSMDPELGPQLVMGGARARIEGACIGRKLPCTPNEYAELALNTCAAKSPRSAYSD